jgi:hypothetical protein
MTTETIKRHISLGRYDLDLADILKTAEARRTALRAKRRATEFSIGDEVRFNDACTQPDLRSNHGVVVGRRGEKLLVKPNRPIGRFARCVDGVWESSPVTVPPSSIDLI